MAKQSTPPIRSLSEADEETLTAMIAWWNKRPKKYEDSGPPRPMNASDVHFVELTQDIPARTGMVIKKGTAKIVRPIMDEIADDPDEITMEYAEIDSAPLEINIWNITSSALSSGDLITVKRLKYGLWVPDSPSTGGGQVVAFTVTSADCVDKTGTGEVFAVACGLTDVAVGDSIDLYDILGCMFSGDPVGYAGLAVKMEDELGYGCRWVIQTLCCPTEMC